MVKKFVALLSSFIGAADLNSEGEKTKKAVAESAMAGAKGFLAMSRVGMGFAKLNLGSSLGNILSKGKLKKGVGAASKKIKGAASSVKGKVAGVLGGTSPLGKKLANFMDKGIVKGALGYLGLGGINKEKATQDVTVNEKDKKKLEGLSYTETKAVDKNGNDLKDEQGNQIYNVHFEKATDAKAFALRSNLSGIGKNLCDMAGQTLKCIGGLAGFDKALEAVVKSGLADELKSTAQYAAHTAGRDDIADKMKSGDILKNFMGGKFSGAFQTSKDKKKKAKKDFEKKIQETEDNVQVSTQMINAVFTLTEKLKKR